MRDTGDIYKGQPCYPVNWRNPAPWNSSRIMEETLEKEQKTFLDTFQPAHGYTHAHTHTQA